MVIEHVEDVLARAHSPLHDIEHSLAPYVAFGIMPVFAFCNAGVALGGDAAALIGPVSLGAALGLLLGKPIGVAGFAWLAVRTGLTRLPEGASWSGLIGVGLLAGIGFTMSLFIASLAFPDPAMLSQAKMGVLCASVIAALVGLAFLHRALPRARTRGLPGAAQP
jgi:NhaA family Na+:H+ antiporter